MLNLQGRFCLQINDAALSGVYSALQHSGSTLSINDIQPLSNSKDAMLSHDLVEGNWQVLAKGNRFE